MQNLDSDIESDSENESLTPSEKIDCLVDEEPIFYVLSKFLTTSDGKQTITDVLANIAAELKILNNNVITSSLPKSSSA